ncbi:MAG: glycosyltransferase, partial [Thermodesulfobacteriota bacterium]|nr:glycosyltransferase [Thermodesulfobacteriota bacterium]
PYNKIFVNDEFFKEPQYLNKVVPEDRPIGGIPEYQVLHSERDENRELVRYERDLKHYIAQYDGGIKYTDDQIQELTNELKRFGIYDDSLIMITSDHGEALGENDVYFFHGLTVTPDQIHVPLLIKPHKDLDICPANIDTHVSSIDIMPTILDLIDFNVCELDLRGVSLIELMKGNGDRECKKRLITAEVQGQIAYITHDSIMTEPKEINRNSRLYYFHVDELCNKEITYSYKDQSARNISELEFSSSLDPQYVITQETESKPDCSIIIPLFNKIEYTRECLNALLKNTSKDLYEVVFVDNGSTDGTIKYLKTVQRSLSEDISIKVVSNEQNLGFAKACNYGANMASGKYLVFLNNDVAAMSNWLKPLIRVTERDSSVAAVGSKLLFPDKTIQHAGVLIIDDQKLPDPLVARHIYYQKPEDFVESNQMRTYQALTAACLLIRRSAFDQVRGFDEGYWNGYEDVDLCFKLQMKGWKLVYQPESILIHYESQSGKERFTKTRENIERLHGRWLGKIQPDIIINRDGSIEQTEKRNIQPYHIPESAPFTHSSESPNVVQAKASIIILTYNQIEFTKKCIDSLKRFTDASYELIFVDNGSTDGTVEYLRSMIHDSESKTDCRLICNKQNLGFAKGCNQGMDIATGEYILLLNNDVVLTEGWLEEMIRCAESDARIGVVGPCSNYVVGSQLDRNADYSSMEEMHSYAAQFRNHHKGWWFETFRIIGFCMLIKREVIDRIGLLDERFGLGNYEDDDYCYRARMAGYKLMVAGDVFIHHFGSRSFAGNGINYTKQIERNKKLFFDKWNIKPEAREQIIQDKAGLSVDSFERSKAEDTKKKETELRVATGMEYLKSGNLERAIESFTSAIEADPMSSEGFNGLGCALFRKGMSAEAEENLKKAIELDGKNPIFWKNLGYIYLNSGRYSDAKRVFETVLPQNYEDPEVVVSLGQIALAENRSREAKRCFTKATAIDHRYAPAHFHLGMLYKIQGQWEEASSSFKNVIALDPDNFIPYNALGHCFFQQKREREALDFFQESLKLNPKQPDIQEMITNIGSSIQVQ